MNASKRLGQALRDLEQARDDIIESWGADTANGRATLLICALRYVQDAVADVALAKAELDARGIIVHADIPLTEEP